MFESSSKLDFLVAPWVQGDIIESVTGQGNHLRKFKIGTCHGLFGYDEQHWYILAVVNDEPGNGHLKDVLEWFENSCKRDHRNLVVQEFFNDSFKDHLLTKQGFELHGEDVIKFYKNMK